MLSKRQSAKRLKKAVVLDKTQGVCYGEKKSLSNFYTYLFGIVFLIGFPLCSVAD